MLHARWKSTTRASSRAKNAWIAEGFSFGITAAGGAGYYLAQLIIDGEAEIDMGSLTQEDMGIG